MNKTYYGVVLYKFTLLYYYYYFCVSDDEHDVSEKSVTVLLDDEETLVQFIDVAGEEVIFVW